MNQIEAIENREVDCARRRTFAIISHPDAGKTTLTERLLKSAGAIREAGEVKAKANRRLAHSDWLEIEQKRGISVTSSVMSFDYCGCRFNLLDTPGHADFSEDTYRTLTAVDCAVMVLDAAKGIESQTLKLFEICRLREIPIITFINKVDREALEPFTILDEIETRLALDTAPMTWPIGLGGAFRGLYDLVDDKAILIDKVGGALCPDIVEVNGPGDPELAARMSDAMQTRLLEDALIAREACEDFDRVRFLGGDLTPVYFGSALKNVGIEALLEALAGVAPGPLPQPAHPRTVMPEEETLRAFVFKVQANMDPNHRDRIAFARICSGVLERGTKVVNSRTDKTLAIHNPIFFLARDRELAEETRAGDVVGIPNHGTLRVGDTLSQDRGIVFTGLPDFAPEILRRVRLSDPLRIKQMRKALHDLAEEGAIRVFKPHVGSNWIVGVVGALQIEILSTRAEQEYGVTIDFEPCNYETARWVRCEDLKRKDAFLAAERHNLAEDGDGDTVYLARNSWELERVSKDWPEVLLAKTKERHANERLPDAA